MYIYIYATTVFYNLLKLIENPSVYMTEDPLKKPQDGPWFGGGQGGEGVRTHDLGIRRRKRWSLQLTQRQSTSRPCLTAVVVDDDNVFLFKLFCNLKKWVYLSEVEKMFSDGFPGRKASVEFVGALADGCDTSNFSDNNMVVSIHGRSPKWMVSNRKSNFQRWFRGTPIFGNLHICIYY